MKADNINFEICVSEKDLKEEYLLKYYETVERIKKYIEEVYGTFERHRVVIDIVFIENESFEKIKNINYNILSRFSISEMAYISSFRYESTTEEVANYEKFLASYLNI